jgi:hypothetical protein
MKERKSNKMEALTASFFGKVSLRRVIVTVSLCLLAVFALPMLAGATGGMDLSWNTIDGGGTTYSTGGPFGLGGTIGQPDAGAMSGGSFGLTGGFWGGSPSAADLIGHVTWQGRPAQPHALQQLPITITLKLGTTEVNYASQVTDPRGNFTVPVGTLASGTYNWRVKGPKYLANSGSVVLSGSTVTWTDMGLMKAGDANNDNIVSVLDFNILKTTFGKQTGDPGYDDRADFTGDQIVSILDFNLLKGNFGIGGAPPLAPGQGGKESK